MGNQITEARAALADEVREAIRNVPVSLRRLGVETGLSHVYLAEVLAGIKVPTQRRAASILAVIESLHQAFGTTPTKGGAARD